MPRGYRDRADDSLLSLIGDLPELIGNLVKAEIDAHRKGFDLLDLHGTVRVEGKLRNPQVGLGRVFPLPTPVIGTAKDVACADLTNQLLATQ